MSPFPPLGSAVDSGVSITVVMTVALPTSDYADGVSGSALVFEQAGGCHSGHSAGEAIDAALRQIDSASAGDALPVATTSLARKGTLADGLVAAYV